MESNLLLKDHLKEARFIYQHALYISLLIGFGLCMLFIRLGFIQLYQHHLYITLSTKNYLDFIPNEPIRGLIYDRNGILLADNIPVFSLDLIPNQISNLPKTLQELKKIISIRENDLHQFYKQLRQHRHFDEIPLKLRLNEAEVDKFAENQYQFPGVLIKARLIRHYPLGRQFSHVLGYVGRINAQELSKINQTNYSASYYIGKLGIEKYYEEKLHGTIGYEEVENDAHGKLVRVLKTVPSTPGHNLYLTIDSQLQQVAEQALSPYHGAIVAIQPATGQILSMISIPSYDPNAFVFGMSQKNYQSLQSADQPLYNRAIRGLYPLGSTIKPFIALASLKDHILPPNETIQDPGWFELPHYSHRFHDWKHNGHGIVNLSRALIVSCDTYFYYLSSKMGIARIDAILKQFGFGSPTGIDLYYEQKGTIASPAWKRRITGTAWYEGDTIISGIGQGFMQATPLQLAVATATLANHGMHFPPYLLLKDQVNDTVSRLHPPCQKPSIILSLHPENWEIVIQAMQAVITATEGTGYRQFMPQPLSYTLAGKTGTAQMISLTHYYAKYNQNTLPTALRDHHLFIVFAPIKHPKIALAIITEHSNRAVATARIILEHYLKQ